MHNPSNPIEIHEFLGELEALSRERATLYDELRETNPGIERRLRHLERMQERLKVELREQEGQTEVPTPLPSNRRQLWERLRSLEQRENRAVLDTYLRDLGGEGD